MFKRILVPLDGSERSEQAIPLAAHIAHVSGGSVLLLRVVSTLSQYGIYSMSPGILSQEALHEDLTKATAYLAQQAASTVLEGIPTRIAVFSGQAVSQILETAQAEQIDLMVMCSHGATGVKRWILGSVAQKVAWQSTMPVLILPESTQKFNGLPFRVGHAIRALVALDGMPFSEAAALPAAQIVAACSLPARGELHLTHLVKLPSLEDEKANEQLGLDIDLRNAALYQAGRSLQSIRERLAHEMGADPSVEITWSVEECDDVADALSKVACGEGVGTHTPSDLLALATHGRRGLDRWVKGSVAEHILSRVTMPLLIVHPHQRALAFAALTNESEQIVIPEQQVNDSWSL